MKRQDEDPLDVVLDSLVFIAVTIAVFLSY